MRLLPLALLAGLAACGTGTGVTPASPEAGGGTGERYFTAKCKSDVADCVAHANETCNGRHTELRRESHAGGLLADAIPGPVTWYTLTFRCGGSGDDSAAEAQQAALKSFVLPECNREWDGKCGLFADQLVRGVTIDAPRLAIEEGAAKRGKLAGFLAKVCEERKGAPMTDECRERFARAFVKVLVARYPSARDPRLHSWCEEHPTDCDLSHPDRLRVLELDFLAAHDRALFASFKRAIETAERRAKADAARAAERGQAISEESEQRRVRAQMIRDAVDGFNQTPTVRVRVEK